MNATYYYQPPPQNIKSTKTGLISLFLYQSSSPKYVAWAIVDVLLLAVNGETQKLLFSIISKSSNLGNVSVVIFLLGICLLPLYLGPFLSQNTFHIPPQPCLMQVQTHISCCYSCMIILAFDSVLDYSPGPSLHIQKAGLLMIYWLRKSSRLVFFKLG